MTRHTDKEIEQAASRFEQLADSLDPDTAQVEDTTISVISRQRLRWCELMMLA
jgi:hypothetical protein